MYSPGRRQREALRRAEPLKDVADSLSVSVDTLYRGYRAGLVKVIRFGTHLRVPAEEIERLARDGLGSLRGGPNRANGKRARS